MPAVGDQHKASGSTTINPFEDTRPRLREYTAQQIATLQSRLDKQLGPEYISSRPGASGQKVHYLAAEKVINLANEVFGFNGWSSEIRGNQIDFVDENQNGKISLGVSVIVRVTLRDGTFHEDMGYGHIENCKGKAAAFEKAKKEGTTDALKRALRTFGNVLGNCIYDKEFVAKVTKIKVAPSKWDAENLHRHHDYAPVKKEVTQSEEILHMNGDSSHGRPSSLSASHLTSRSPPPAPHTETDDDFGIADFDDADFSEDHTGHPDEIALPADDQRSSLTTNNSTYQRPDASVPDPVTLPRVGITTPSKPPNTRQFIAPNTATRAMPTGPTTTSDTYQGMQPPTGHKSQSNADQTKPVPSHDQQQSSNDTHHLSSPKTSSHHVNPHLPQHQHPPSNAAPQIPPVGFYSARAATHVNSDSNAVIPSSIPKFDPHAESPSIRKTTGIDHNKTIPVKRGVGGAPVVASPTVRDVIPPRTNPPRDFVNPSADMHRRIGAPGTGMQSPGAMTGSAYRPPTRRGPDPSVAGGGGGRAQSNSIVKRPPLGDLSNMHQSNTGAADDSDAKRQRISGSENRTMGNHATSAK